MNVPIELLRLRKELMSRGDNQRVAKKASSNRKKFTSDDIDNAVRKGRTPHAKIVIALHEFYTEKQSMLQELSNIELAQ